ncbi:nose resistant to fluoxetine protein 6-like [Elysia marginata]|uniref:Nose resistant to fluoxetine protein 6-like n=1 Tax=Elysia marginata TaxID=1093978 RepID=A0AAV4FC56_9GAST|nr:nose resistant to fluoxetine protein 6-like [Elysia marginata]
MMIRLTPPYALIILTIVGLQQYCGEGPLWPTVMPIDKHQCEKNWWANLFYINNLVRNSVEDMCFLHTWFLANDMQFFLISPVMLIALCFHKWVGIAVCSTVLLVSAVTTGVLSTQNQWPISVLQQMSPETESYFQDYYIAPWCRIGPFVIGILTGFFLVENPRKRIRITKVSYSATEVLPRDSFERRV